MKCLVGLFLLLACFPSHPALQCSTSEFRLIALQTHDPASRSELIRKWLQQNIQNCTQEQTVYLYNNLAAWLGTSDSLEFRSIIEDHYWKKN
jgi:hypothetical protein